MVDKEKLDFEWDEHNTAHIARHDVTPAEVEQVFANGARYLKTDEKPEVRDLVIGETDKGRVLIVSWTKRGTLARTVTAYPANRKARKVYFERKRQDAKAAETND